MTRASCTLLVAMLAIGGERVEAQFVVDQSGAGTHTTIQAAISAAVDGFEILVMPGLYLERIDFEGKAVHVRSSAPADPNVVSATVIDGAELGSVVTFQSGEAYGSVLEGFTVRRGRSDTHGGGVFCVAGSSPRILRNKIMSNFSNHNGGGIYCADGASPWVLQNVILGNRCDARGGGIYCESASPRIEHNVIDGNLAGCSAGGGIYLATGSDAILVLGNEILRNFSRLGGGIAVAGAAPRIERNQIIRNYAIPRGGGISLANADATLVSNVVAGNRAEVGAAVDCNQSSPAFRSNTFVGNWPTDAAALLFVSGSQVDLTGNIVAFSRAGIGVQVLAGSTVTADYNCMFSNPGGDFSGTIIQGPNNIFVDPQLIATGTWVFSGLDEEDEGPPCDGEERLELIAHMNGQGAGNGFAQYRLRLDRERFDVAVFDFPPGTHDVRINDTVVGQIFVGGNGQGQLEFDTNDGNFPPDFPDVLMGDVADVGGIIAAALSAAWAGEGDIWLPGDEHLTDDSPARDAGDPSAPPEDIVDLDAQPRLSATAVDIGADEIVPPGNGDSDADGDIDFADMGRFQACFRGADAWMPDPACSKLDFDGDADIDIDDWNAFVDAVTGP